jgi:hypothetical protein
MKTIGGLRKLRHCGGERIDWIVTCTGLYDEPRVGAPRTVSDEQVEAIIVKTLETTPPARRSGARDPWPRRRASVTAAARAIHAYVDAHNERGTPFK